MRRTASLLAVTGLIAAAGLVAATPASAANYTVDGCAGTPGGDDTPSLVVYQLTTGSTVTYTFVDPCEFLEGFVESGVTIDDGLPGYLTVRIDSADALAAFGSGDLAGMHIQAIVGCDFPVADEIPPELSPSFITDCAGPAAAAPADTNQQVGLPVSGSCDAVDDAGMGMGTSVTGGWTKSYAAWPNGGTGGPVCTRTLRYSPAKATWVLA